MSIADYLTHMFSYDGQIVEAGVLVVAHLYPYDIVDHDNLVLQFAQI